jgi:hypothetical protein
MAAAAVGTNSPAGSSDQGVANINTDRCRATLSLIGGSANSHDFWENLPALSDFGALLEFFLTKKECPMKMRLASSAV